MTEVTVHIKKQEHYALLEKPPDPLQED